jgi:hypothetical protein
VEIKKRIFVKKEKMYKELFRYVLPEELSGDFELVGLKETEGELHLDLDEKNLIPIEFSDKDLVSNGFYESSTVTDFPLRKRKVVLHIRRRRWVDKEGRSYSRQWELSASGTRYSKEFAAFLKDAFGYVPDTYQPSRTILLH